jgi:hypothetical protein
MAKTTEKAKEIESAINRCGIGSRRGIYKFPLNSASSFPATLPRSYDLCSSFAIFFHTHRNRLNKAIEVDLEKAETGGVL